MIIIIIIISALYLNKQLYLELLPSFYFFEVWLLEHLKITHAAYIVYLLPSTALDNL